MRTTQDELIEGIDKRMEAEDNPGALKYLAELKEHLRKSEDTPWSMLKSLLIGAAIGVAGYWSIYFIFIR